MWIASSRFVSENNKESKIINYVARISSCPPPLEPTQPLPQPNSDWTQRVYLIEPLLNNTP